MYCCFLLKKRHARKAQDGYHMARLKFFDLFCSHLLELSKAMPFSQEEDVCSIVRGDLSSEVAGAQLHLIIGSRFTPLVDGILQQLVEILTSSPRSYLSAA